MKICILLIWILITGCFGLCATWSPLGHTHWRNLAILHDMFTGPKPVELGKFSVSGTLLVAVAAGEGWGEVVENHALAFRTSAHVISSAKWRHVTCLLLKGPILLCVQRVEIQRQLQCEPRREWLAAWPSERAAWLLNTVLVATGWQGCGHR